MNEITKAYKLYKIVLVDDEEIVVTEPVAEFIKDEMKTENFIEIDWNMYNKYEIKRIIEVKQKTTKWFSYICEYWTRHPMYGKEWFEKCDCDKKFKVEWWKFYDWLTDRWYKFEYASDIQKSWQELFLKSKIWINK